MASRTNHDRGLAAAETFGRAANKPPLLGNPSSPAARSLGEFLTSEHKLLAELLARTERGERGIYNEFRQALLRHIRIEERLLFPMAARKRAGTPLAISSRLRLDHSALAALMALPPQAATLDTLGSIFLEHNSLEEGPEGAYQQCADLAGGESTELMLCYSATPAVRVSPWNCGAGALEAVRRVLIHCGYGTLPLGA